MSEHVKVSRNKNRSKLSTCSGSWPKNWAKMRQGLSCLANVSCWSKLEELLKSKIGGKMFSVYKNNEFGSLEKLCAQKKSCRPVATRTGQPQRVADVDLVCLSSSTSMLARPAPVPIWLTLAAPSKVTVSFFKCETLQNRDVEKRDEIVICILCQSMQTHSRGEENIITWEAPNDHMLWYRIIRSAERTICCSTE